MHAFESCSSFLNENTAAANDKASETTASRMNIPWIARVHFSPASPISMNVRTGRIIVISTTASRTPISRPVLRKSQRLPRRRTSRRGVQTQSQCRIQSLAAEAHRRSLPGRSENPCSRIQTVSIGLHSAPPSLQIRHCCPGRTVVVRAACGRSEHRCNRRQQRPRGC